MSTVCNKKSKLPARHPLALAVSLVVLTPAYALAAETVLPEVQVQAASQGEDYLVDKSANQKFTAPLSETPKSITVIPQAILQDTNAQTLKEALSTTPGITFGGGEGGIAIGDRPFIRGFDSFQSIYVDGIRDIGSQTRETFAVEQVEVIKGPSGAYDGRGSAGGSVNTITKQAQAGTFGSASLGLGTDSYVRAEVDGNMQIGDNAAFRIIGMSHSADTPGREGVEVKRQGWAPSLTLGLNGPTQVSMSLYHFESDDVPDWGAPYDQSGTLGQPVGVPVGKPVGSRDTWYGVAGRDFAETSSDIATLKISHEFNDSVKLTNTLRYGVSTNEYFVTRPGIDDATPAGSVIQSNSRDRGNETTSLINLTDVTFAFKTGDIKHTMNTGFEISREENVNRGFSGGELCTPVAPATSCTVYVPVGNSNPNVAYAPVTRDAAPSAEAETSNRSLYAFDTMELTEKVSVNAGLRYDSYSTKITTTNLENDKSFLNYQLGVVYKLAPTVNVYSAYGTSSSPIGMAQGDYSYGGAGLTAGTENLDPERSKSFEVGAKWMAREGLDLTAAIFHTEKSNARIEVDAPTVADPAATAIVNGGEQVVQGIELGAAGKLSDKWDVFAGYTYLDSEQTKVGDDVDLNAIGSVGSKGKQLAGIAKQSASLWSTYQLMPKLSVGGGVFYMDKVYANPGNTGYVPSWVRYDAMAKYDVSKTFDVQLNVQNLTDKRYFNQTYFRHYAVVAPGRSATLTATVKF